MNSELNNAKAFFRVLYTLLFSVIFWVPGHAHAFDMWEGTGDDRLIQSPYQEALRLCHLHEFTVINKTTLPIQGGFIAYHMRQYYLPSMRELRDADLLMLQLAPFKDRIKRGLMSTRLRNLFDSPDFWKAVNNECYPGRPIAAWWFVSQLRLLDLTSGALGVTLNIFPYFLFRIPLKAFVRLIRVWGFIRSFVFTIAPRVGVETALFAGLNFASNTAVDFVESLSASTADPMAVREKLRKGENLTNDEMRAIAQIAGQLPSDEQEKYNEQRARIKKILSEAKNWQIVNGKLVDTTRPCPSDEKGPPFIGH